MLCCTLLCRAPLSAAGDLLLHANLRPQQAPHCRSAPMAQGAAARCGTDVPRRRRACCGAGARGRARGHRGAEPGLPLRMASVARRSVLPFSSLHAAGLLPRPQAAERRRRSAGAVAAAGVQPSCVCAYARLARRDLLSCRKPLVLSKGGRRASRLRPAGERGGHRRFARGAGRSSADRAGVLSASRPANGAVSLVLVLRAASGPLASQAFG